LIVFSTNALKHMLPILIHYALNVYLFAADEHFKERSLIEVKSCWR